ncbi:3-hydroxyacyl-CoA dehydrogenase family protein [Cytobacillus purgationiresistens]|uniref:3-hydroxybutyryl-CoA dehydrogenase n=1 Tax=Cytobacillus purgationiresistens TaxID=863449 RepID=A0ABU0AGN3_9BACI|nr:3-hydroxyacyl-CoA dehydrogenase NAD-binding domain-containing protein [Cytobacillus purgationiresistens]MDQ0270414.1 3-hydroxybutyryl-CoA dehydrogenase [Cytobacillus purgationiresistens]
MERITIIGAGTMGKGIALVCAQAGFEVIVQDIQQESLDKCKSYIDRFLDAGNIRYMTSLEEAVASSDLVIEAVLEIMDLKKSIFKTMDQFSPRHAILATNTSTMSPTEIASHTSRPEKCIALHFFNPVHKMKLIEVVTGLETSKETVKAAFDFGSKIGKECVKINEFPGFATSRMNCLIGNEAMNMVMEGVGSIADIDQAMKLGLNHPMGPLELADLVGLDSRLRNMEYLHKTLGEKFRPCPILQKYVSAGWTGKKAGRGFYQYDERGNKI